MNEYMPNVIDAVAQNRWINALNMNAKILVTESVADYVALEKTKPENVVPFIRTTKVLNFIRFWRLGKEKRLPIGVSHRRSFFKA